MTLTQWQHVAGISVAVAGLAFTSSFGAGAAIVAAYVLAAAMGALLYRQGETFAVVGTVAGNVLLGYLGGIALSLAIATGLLVWFLNAPVDFVLWQLGLIMWDSWAGVGVAILGGFFVAGLAVLLD